MHHIHSSPSPHPPRRPSSSRRRPRGARRELEELAFLELELTGDLLEVRHLVLSPDTEVRDESLGSQVVREADGAKGLVPLSYLTTG